MVCQDENATSLMPVKWSKLHTEAWRSTPLARSLNNNNVPADVRVGGTRALTQRKRVGVTVSHYCLRMLLVCVRACMCVCLGPVRACCRPLVSLIVLFNNRLCIEWLLLYSEQLQQEAVPCWITLAWMQGLVTQGILSLSTHTHTHTFTKSHTHILEPIGLDNNPLGGSLKNQSSRHLGSCHC